MNFFLVFVLAFAPGALWMLYFYRRDHRDPEPVRHILRLFVYGILLSIPAVFGEALFAWAGGFLMAVVVAPVVEEFLKYYTVKSTAYDYKAFDEPLDGIIYGAAVALGFASIENLFYIASEYYKQGGHVAFVVGLRALLTVPGHAVFAAMWGYPLGLGVILDDEEKHRRYIRNGVLLSMGLHALFNFLLLNALPGAVILLILIYPIWRSLNKRIRKAHRKSPHHPDNSDPDEESEEDEVISDSDLP